MLIPTPFTGFGCKYPQLKAESLHLRHILIAREIKNCITAIKNMFCVTSVTRVSHRKWVAWRKDNNNDLKKRFRFTLITSNTHTYTCCGNATRLVELLHHKMWWNSVSERKKIEQGNKLQIQLFSELYKYELIFMHCPDIFSSVALCSRCQSKQRISERLIIRWMLFEAEQEKKQKSKKRYAF